MITKDTIICRCEDLTYAEVLEAIDLGLSSLEEIKKYLRAGMGPCQGRTCGRLISQIIAQRTGRKPDEIGPMTYRPPLKTIPIKTLAGGEND